MYSFMLTLLSIHIGGAEYWSTEVSPGSDVEVSHITRYSRRNGSGGRTNYSFQGHEDYPEIINMHLLYCVEITV